MSGQSFHTALFGGFRKKDVVSYLSDERQKQTEELEALQEQIKGLEESAEEASANSKVSQQLAADLQSELETANAEKAARIEEIGMLRAQLEEMREQFEELKASDAAEREILLSRVNKLEAQAISPEQLKAMNDALWTEKENVSRLQGQLLSSYRQSAEASDSAEVLRALCERMENTLDHLLEGPYYLARYTREETGTTEEPVQAAPAPTEPEPEEPAGKKTAVIRNAAQPKNSVSQLLSRIRKSMK